MIRQLTRESGPAAVRAAAPTHLIGIDEVGLGACAGPVVVGAVVAQASWAPETVRDSKSFSDSGKATAHQKRLDVVRGAIKFGALSYATLWAGPRDVDNEGVDLAVQKLTFWLYDLYRRQYPGALTVLDGSVSHYFRCAEYENTLAFPDADQLVSVVSAASIVAKTQRDHYMLLLESAHPGYGFGKHKGYWTKEHKEAVTARGLCEEHRRSYRNIQQYESRYT